MRRRLTWAEQLFDQGFQQGLEIARQKGVEQGIREILLRQLGLRFGPLSDDVKRRLEEIHSVDDLNQIVDQMFVAHSLEEMGLQ